MATIARSSRGSLVVIFVIVAQCFLHAIVGTPIPSDEQTNQTDTLLSDSNRQSKSNNNEDGAPAIDVKSGIPYGDFEPRRDDFRRPSADMIFVRKKRPHVLKSSPPVNRHQYSPGIEPTVSPAPFPDVPISSAKPPCPHTNVRIEPVEIPVSISPLPFFTTVHPPYPRVEPAEIPASVRPVLPSFFEPSSPPPPPPPPPPPKSVTTPAPASVGTASPSVVDLPSSSESSLPIDFNVGDIFASTAAAEPHQPTGDSALTPVQDTDKTQVPIVQTEEKPQTDQKPVEPKPHRSVIASILHKKEHLKEKIHHKKKEEENVTAGAQPHHSIVASIKHKKEHLKEKFHHEKKEENATNTATVAVAVAPAPQPHRSIVASIKHKKEHLREKIHHERKNEDISHKQSEVVSEEEKVPPIAETSNSEHRSDGGASHHKLSLLHTKFQVPAVSSLLHKIHHKREVHQHAALKLHGSAISSVLHRSEHLKKKIHHNLAAVRSHSPIVSSVLHKKEHLKGLIHHEQKKGHSIIASILHKKGEAKEVKIPAKEAPAGEAHHHHELIPALHNKIPHESVVSSLRHKIHHKRESSSVQEKGEESLNFDVPHIGLPMPKSSILHKLKSDEEHEHKPHSLLKDLLHKV